MYKQEKTAKLLQIAMQDILRNFNTPEIKLVSVMQVDLNANCGNARFYISILSHHDSAHVVKELNDMQKQLRYLLGEKIKNKVRKLPEISFYDEKFLEKAYYMDKFIEEKLNEDLLHSSEQ